MSTFCPPYQFTVRIACASMGCVFPFLWEETVSQFILDSRNSLCNPGETQFKEFLLHGPSLPNAEVTGVSHISVFPMILIAAIFRKRAWARREERMGGEGGREREGEVMYVYSFHLSYPSPFLCLSLLLLEKSPRGKRYLPRNTESISTNSSPGLSPPCRTFLGAYRLMG